MIFILPAKAFLRRALGSATEGARCALPSHLIQAHSCLQQSARSCRVRAYNNGYQGVRRALSLLLPEREVHAEIGINWFLDREIPKGAYVRILAESLLWEEPRIRTTEGLTTCMEPHRDRGWTIASSSWNFLRKRRLDREQELITYC